MSATGKLAGLLKSKSWGTGLADATVPDDVTG